MGDTGTTPLNLFIDKLKNYLLSNIKSPVASAINIQPIFTAIIDSGATKHFLKEKHRKYISSVKELCNGPIAQLPNQQFVKATHSGYFKIHENISHPHLTNELLISVVQVCDDGCIVFFTKKDFSVLKNNKLLFTGP